MNDHIAYFLNMSDSENYYITEFDIPWVGYIKESDKILKTENPNLYISNGNLLTADIFLYTSSKKIDIDSISNIPIKVHKYKNNKGIIFTDTPVQQIESLGFNNRNVDELKLPNSVTTICYHSGIGVNKLSFGSNVKLFECHSNVYAKEIHYSGNLSDWVNITFECWSAAPGYDDKIKLYFNEEEVKSLYFDNITTLPSWSFCGLTLDTVTIPASLSIFGSNTFTNSSIKDCYYELGQDKTFYDGTTGPFTGIIENTHFIGTLDDLLNQTNVVHKGIPTNAQHIFIDGSELTELTINKSEPFTINSNLFVNSPIKYILVESPTTFKNGSFHESKLESVIIKDSATKVSFDTNSFSYCKNLKNIQISDKVDVSFDYHSFLYNKFTNLTIPTNTTMLHSSAFSHSDLLESLTYNATHATLKEVYDSDKLSHSWPNLKYIEFGNLVEYIPKGICSNCEKITLVTIPSTCKYIGKDAFSFTNIENVEIPDSVSELGERAFYGTPLRNINIGSGITKIPRACYAYNDNILDTITIPNNVTTIESGAFMGTSMKNFVVEGNGKTIYSDAFQGCATSLVLPEVLVKLSNTYLYPELNVKDLYYTGDINKLPQILIDCNIYAKYIYVNGELCNPLSELIIDENLSELNLLNKVTKLIFTDNVTKIPKLKNFNELLEVVLGKNIQSIPSSTFSGCNKLHSIILNEGLIYIGGSAFYNCHALKSINLPSTLEEIGNYAFAYTGLLEFKLLGSLLSLGTNILTGVNLETLIIEKDFNIKIDLGNLCCSVINISIDPGNTIYDSRNNCNAIIDTETNEFILGGDNFSIPSSVTSIKSYAFYLSKLTSIVIPNTITYIGTDAFAYSALLSINIPESVKTISDRAFYYCDNLKTVTISEGVEYIGQHAFSYCNFETITIPSTIKVIEDEAFSRMARHLTQIVVVNNPNYIVRDNLLINVNTNTLITGSVKNATDLTILNINKIANDAFYGCNSLVKVTIYGETIVGEEAFSGCDSLKEVILDGVIELLSYAFGGCDNLYTVRCNNPDIITSNAFLDTYIISMPWSKIYDTYYEYKGVVYTDSFYDHNIDDFINTIKFIRPSVTSLNISKRYKFDTSGYNYIYEIYRLRTQNVSEIIVDSSNFFYDSRDNCNAVIETLTNSLLLGCASTVIPNTVTKIAKNSFRNANVESIVIPDSVEYIEASVFNTNLKEITLGRGIKSIDNFIHKELFADYSSWSGVKITFTSTTPCKLNFDISTIASAIYVPEEALEDYKTNPYWWKYTDIIYPIQ